MALVLLSISPLSSHNSSQLRLQPTPISTSGKSLGLLACPLPPGIPFWRPLLFWRPRGPESLPAPELPELPWNFSGALCGFGDKDWQTELERLLVLAGGENFPC